MKSLRGVTTSSSVLNFRMFAHSTTLMSQLYNIYFGLPYISQESMAQSQLQLDYSFTRLQNYSLCESLINPFEVLP